ncbi:MAG: CHAT domain-containing protein [Gammaproteobacteria bacterium]
MRFKKKLDEAFSAKAISGALVLTLAMMNMLNTGCQPLLVDQVQNAPHARDYKRWVLDAEILREQGDLISAQKKLELALQDVKKGQVSPADSAAVELAIGYNLFLLNRLNAAEQYLKSAYAKTTGNDYLQALADQYLANFYFADEESQQALSHVKHGLELLQHGAHEDLRLSLALLDWGANQDAPLEKAQKLLSLSTDVGRLSNGPVKSKLILKTAQFALDLKPEPLPAALLADIQQQNYQLLNGLQSWATQTHQLRLLAEATGKMAALYEWQDRLEEALLLTDRAISEAQQANEKVLLAQVAAQKGDLLRRMGDNERALSAYQIAVDSLYAIRIDMPISLPDGRSALNTLIDPIYRNYVDLLLQPSPPNGTDQADQGLIMKAIDSMEAIKQADLQDFFLGRCEFVSEENNLDWKHRALPGAAIFYPILLKDRIELVLKTDQKLIRRTVPVSADQVKEQALTLVHALQFGKDYRASSKQLFNWLFRPLADELRQANPNVILFVPDRSIRAVPLAALYDGQSFIVERYGIVTLPSLNLESLGPVDKHKEVKARALLAGLSIPDGASIDQLPRNITEYLSDKPLPRESIIEELSLPSVEEEIRTVAEKEQSRTLLNNAFTATALKSDIETGQYDKVHIASHGYFGKNAKESFIMAYDQNMTLLDIRATLEAENLKAAPIELLTLSACKTAEGDDSMLLGFSGLAVKSNVLSAVGSLWSINDEATMQFMRLFYDGLSQSLDKAQAMRAAQISMIKTKKFRHPFFWSPFILIGNWQ